MLLGIKKNKREREMENQSVGVVFSPSIPYIKKNGKRKKENQAVEVAPRVYIFLRSKRCMTYANHRNDLPLKFVRENSISNGATCNARKRPGSAN
jgi:hypothetical protein